MGDDEDEFSFFLDSSELLNDELLYQLPVPIFALRNMLRIIRPGLLLAP